MDESNIQQEFKENYRYADSYWAPFIKDAQAYTLAASGLTWDDQERRALIKEGREPLELNIMRRPLSFFSGWMRDNLNSIIYTGVEGSDDKTADQFTKLGYGIWDKGNGYVKFLDAYDEAMKSGISLCGIRMDYSRDFVNGDISFWNRTYNSFYLDPTFTEIDLQDCGYAITRDLMNPQAVKQLLPDLSQSDIDDLGRSFRDDKFMLYRPNVTTANMGRNMIAYDQYYRRSSRTRKYLVDLDNSFSRDITDYDADDMDKLKVGLKRLADVREQAELSGAPLDQIPNVEIRDIVRPYIELHVMLNGKLVFSGEDATGINDVFPFVPCLCYFEKSIWMPSQRVQGMASCQWSAQREFNKRHMKIVDMMDSTISTGFKYFIGAVPDVSDLQQSGGNRLIGIDPEHAPEGLNSVQELAGGGANPTLIQYQEVLDRLTLTLGNVTEASLGMDEKRNTLVSGRLAQVQIAQNLLANRKVFDNVDTSQQVLGGLVLRAIQLNYSPGKVQRILGEEPTEQFYDKEFEQFDAVVKEGVRSKSQRDAYYYELVNLKRDGIVDVPESEIVRALSMAGISDLQAAIDEQEKQKAEQQQKIDAQERLAMELGNSQKESNLALAQERRARVLADIGLHEERVSEAAENRAQAALARAKTITEIASMNEDRLIKVLDFVNQLEMQEAAAQEQVSRDVESESDAVNAETEGSMQNQMMQQLEQQAQAAQAQQMQGMSQQAPL